jgi:hypothetical protein
MHTGERRGGKGSKTQATLSPDKFSKNVFKNAIKTRKREPSRQFCSISINPSPSQGFLK